MILSRRWPSAGRVLSTTLTGLTLAFLGLRGASADDHTPSPPRLAQLPLIDELIKAQWDEAGIKPSAVATDPEFLRRAYLDLLGRIPNLAETQAFLGSKGTEKRRKLVEHLMNQPDFARNFANVWSALLIGRQRPRREVDRDALNAWLRRQFLDGTPWDRVVYELVTAKGSNKENGAVNFSLAHLDSGAVPLTSMTTRLFLGKQIQCTQCHDHPTNDWKQRDFWGINAFFKGLRRRDVRKATVTGAVDYDHTELTDEPTEAFSQFDRRNGLVGIAYPRYIDGREISPGTDVDRRVELGKFIADPGNMDLARAFVNRMWGHFLGRGIVHPVDDFGDHNPPSHPELLNRLAEEFRKSDYDVRSLIRWITASQAYNLSSGMTKSNEKDEVLFSHMALKPMSPEQLFDSLLTATSAHQAGGEDGSGERRERWLNQFVIAFSNDEGDEGTSFQGTIPQALMMMNGDLMERATGGRSGGFLADLYAKAMNQSRQPPAAYMVHHLYLAALSRPPSARDLRVASEFLNSYPDKVGVLQDLFWALLNSNEFVLNH
ncbi:MAG: DUF1549 and DUF1553 domain-containing protein [Isosphaeraceae bacterium]